MRPRLPQSAALALAVGLGCQGRATTRSASDEPASATEHGATALTLRFELPGTSRVMLSERIGACGGHGEARGAASECRFTGTLGEFPSCEYCEGGCTSWTYRFEDDRVVDVLLERTHVDVDMEWYRELTSEAETIARELERRFGPAPRVELGTWDDVENGPEGAKVLIATRSWRVADGRVDWALEGVAGHHPVITLRISAH